MSLASGRIGKVCALIVAVLALTPTPTFGRVLRVTHAFTARRTGYGALTNVLTPPETQTRPD